MTEQARQSWEQGKKHEEPMAVLINQVNIRDAEMKHLIEAAHGGAKGSSTAVASIETFDLNSELRLDLERFKTFLIANSIPKEKEAQVFLTNQTIT